MSSKGSSADSITASSSVGSSSSKDGRLTTHRATGTFATFNRSRQLLSYGPIISFSVPWVTRQTGYMMIGRPDMTGVRSKRSPNNHKVLLDAWLETSRPQVMINYPSEGVTADAVTFRTTLMERMLQPLLFIRCISVSAGYAVRVDAGIPMMI